MAAEAITLLIPGAGPPPTRIASVSRCLSPLFIVASDSRFDSGSRLASTTFRLQTQSSTREQSAIRNYSKLTRRLSVRPIPIRSAIARAGPAIEISISSSIRTPHQYGYRPRSMVFDARPLCIAPRETAGDRKSLICLNRVDTQIDSVGRERGASGYERVESTVDCWSTSRLHLVSAP